ncbi:MAG: hypothetical protein Q8N77_03235 [Nanoarchaeota archaeon]|nr:hypothetical protein [Nanoarchaeota archaeon]
MGIKGLLKIAGVSVLVYSAFAFIANPSGCISSCSKPKSSIVQPSEMKTVRVDGKLDYKDVRHYMTDEQIRRVEDTAKEDYKTVVKELKTPLEAMIYCTKVLSYEKDINVYGKKDYWASFKNIHKNKKDDCDGGAFAAAAILSDDGFPPYIAVFRNNKEAHAVFVYKTTEGKYGSIGINTSDCVSGCGSIEELRDRLSKVKDKYTHIKVYDLSKQYPDYIDNDKDNKLE